LSSPLSEITTKNVVGESVHRAKAQSGHWLGFGKSNQKKSNGKPGPNRFPANPFQHTLVFGPEGRIGGRLFTSPRPLAGRVNAEPVPLPRNFHPPIPSEPPPYINASVLG
jgi:hypothetical protein